MNQHSELFQPLEKYGYYGENFRGSYHGLCFDESLTNIRS